MFHARVLSLAVAAPPRRARRPAAAGKPAGARRRLHMMGRSKPGKAELKPALARAK
jgi:hypothetical protein